MFFSLSTGCLPICCMVKALFLISRNDQPNHHSHPGKNLTDLENQLRQFYSSPWKPWCEVISGTSILHHYYYLYPTNECQIEVLPL